MVNSNKADAQLRLGILCGSDDLDTLIDRKRRDGVIPDKSSDRSRIRGEACNSGRGRGILYLMTIRRNVVRGHAWIWASDDSDLRSNQAFQN